MISANEARRRAKEPHLGDKPIHYKEIAEWVDAEIKTAAHKGLSAVEITHIPSFLFNKILNVLVIHGYGIVANPNDKSLTVQWRKRVNNPLKFIEVELNSATLPDKDGMYIEYVTTDEEVKKGYWDTQEQIVTDTKDGGDFDASWSISKWREL